MNDQCHTTPTPSAVSPFQFENKPVRIDLDEQGQPWFNAIDVCSALEHTNPRKAIADHVDDEDVTIRYTLTAGGKQPTNHINESGLYALIFGSTKPEAKRFKRWVTSEVLPLIRKTGQYSTPRPSTSLPPTIYYSLAFSAKKVATKAFILTPSFFARIAKRA